MSTTVEGIQQVLSTLETLLVQKNQAYGDSALAPVRIFSQAGVVEGLLTRIDDKLGRIRHRGFHASDEDTLLDLMGYLVLLSVALKQREREP